MTKHGNAHYDLLVSSWNNNKNIIISNNNKVILYVYVTLNRSATFE